MNKIRATIKNLPLTPEILFKEFPSSSLIQEKIIKNRKFFSEIIHGKQDKLIAIVGPCSIHDPEAAIEYAYRLKKAAEYFKEDLFVLMRVYFEKPRTRLGWQGLIRDPYLDGSHQIETGLRLARQLLLDINYLGLAIATEFLDPMIAPFLFDLVTWNAVGARTSNSPVHRELASGLPMPVGFKNSIDGNIHTAIDAVKVAAEPHHFLNINEQGFPCIMQTFGNPDCHVILRGSQHETNYQAEWVAKTTEWLTKAGVTSRFLIDCSHGNSEKSYSKQKNVLYDILYQLQSKDSPIAGVMLESHLVAGKQLFSQKETLVYGQSITDECLSWCETLPLLEQLANVRKKFKKIDVTDQSTSRTSIYR